MRPTRDVGVATRVHTNVGRKVLGSREALVPAVRGAADIAHEPRFDAAKERAQARNLRRAALGKRSFTVYGSTRISGQP